MGVHCMEMFLVFNNKISPTMRFCLRPELNCLAYKIPSCFLECEILFFCVLILCFDKTNILEMKMREVEKINSI